MGVLLEKMKLDDDLLEGVTGGTEGGISYGMDKDPLYNEFYEFWNGRDKKGATGAESRMDFMDSFKKWVKDGTPENIAGWYNRMNA